MATNKNSGRKNSGRCFHKNQGAALLRHNQSLRQPLSVGDDGDEVNTVLESPLVQVDLDGLLK